MFLIISGTPLSIPLNGFLEPTLIKVDVESEGLSIPLNGFHGG